MSVHWMYSSHFVSWFHCICDVNWDYFCFSFEHQFSRLEASCDVKAIKGNYNIMFNFTFTVFWILLYCTLDHQAVIKILHIFNSCSWLYLGEKHRDLTDGTLLIWVWHVQWKNMLSGLFLSYQYWTQWHMDTHIHIYACQILLGTDYQDLQWKLMSK